jgi:two-component system, OmpR family, response regulator
MHALVVEDDEKISSFVAKGLREAGFVVDVAADGVEGLEIGLSGRFDVAVVDVMLPGLDGLTLIERLRAARVQTPVLILSARRTVDDRVRGLQAGGDDYMVKPFAFSEVLARVQALLRRASASSEPTVLRVADLEVDRMSRRVMRGDREIVLQAKEYALLEYLVTNAGRIVTRTSILEKVYDYNFDPQTNVIDVLVSRLRGKVDREFERKLIHTVRGMGYVLKEE